MRRRGTGLYSSGHGRLGWYPLPGSPRLGKAEDFGLVEDAQRPLLSSLIGPWPGISIKKARPGLERGFGGHRQADFSHAAARIRHLEFQRRPGSGETSNL
jgi:hypothetical protein